MKSNEALNRIFDNLMNGAVYGHDRITWREDFPDEAIAGKAMFSTALHGMNLSMKRRMKLSVNMKFTRIIIQIMLKPYWMRLKWLDMHYNKR